MLGLFGKGSKDPDTTNIKQKKKELKKLVKDKKYDEAIRKGNEILKKIPHENDVLFILGGIYYMKNKHLSAISYFEKSLEIATFDTQVLILKGNSHYNLGQLEKAIECCNKIKELDPKNKGVQELELKIDSAKN